MAFSLGPTSVNVVSAPSQCLGGGKCDHPGPRCDARRFDPGGLIGLSRNGPLLHVTSLHPRLGLAAVPGGALSPPREPDPLNPIAARAAAGEAAAVELLLRELSPGLLRAIRAVIGEDGVEDVLQESLLALLHALPAFRAEGSIRGYATRIAVRAALYARRRRKREQERAKVARDLHALRATLPLPRRSRTR